MSAQAAEAKTAPAPTAKPGPFRVLVADADRSICEEIQQLVQGSFQTAQYAMAMTGQEALGLMKSGKVDLAFVDVALPGISGLDVIREARKVNASPFTVITSAVVLPNWAMVASDLFSYEFLKKPFAAEDIGSIIKARQRMVTPTKILLIDSSAQARAVVRKMIGASRFVTELEETDNGGHALKLARLKTYDIVLVDLALTGMNGLETACQFQAQHPELTVIVMMAGNDTGTVSALKQFGLRSILKKPFWTRDFDFMMHHVSNLRRPYLMNATCPAETRAFSVIP
jgi:DNA-binding NtrC family response regulator